jgi:hypothetical protein
MEELLALLTDAERTLVLSCYRKDENTLPNEYVLQPVSIIMPETKSEDEGVRVRAGTCSGTRCRRHCDASRRGCVAALSVLRRAAGGTFSSPSWLRCEVRWTAAPSARRLA